MAAPGSPGASAASPLFGPAVISDQKDAPQASVDVRRVDFGQVEKHLLLRIVSANGWRTGQLASTELCVVLLRDDLEGRLCVASRPNGAPGLRFGQAGRSLKPVRGVVERPGPRRLVARLSPRELGIRHGSVAWHVQSGTDRAPDDGDALARISAYGAPDCFGAAARATRHCDNPSLRARALPRPNDALLMHDGPCQPARGARRYAVIDPCDVGSTSSGSRRAQVALIGDSHASHLRAAVDVAASARGWRAVTMTRPGCPFSTEIYTPSLASCRTHTDEALMWLRAHPSIHTVITSAAARLGFSRGGYLAVWRRVPRSVRRILVVRDVPRQASSTPGCVEAVRRRHAKTEGACPISRSFALIPDGHAAAAASAGGRVRVVDFTRLFCDVRFCFPVIGGVYVYRDADHINRMFSATLGSYLLNHLGR